MSGSKVVPGTKNPSSPPRHQAWTENSHPGSGKSSSSGQHPRNIESQLAKSSVSSGVASRPWGLPQFILVIFSPTLIGLAFLTFYFALLPGSEPCELSARVLYAQRLNITDAIDIRQKAESFGGCWIDENDSGIGRIFFHVLIWEVYFLCLIRIPYKHISRGCRVPCYFIIFPWSFQVSRRNGNPISSFSYTSRLGAFFGALLPIFSGSVFSGCTWSGCLS